MKKTFLFRNVAVHSAKVSHALAVGLPSLTGVTGLASAFAAELAKDMNLAPTELVSSGVLFAFEDYVLHEGYKKVTEKDKSGASLATRALASAYASFKAHLIIEVRATTPAAEDALANLDLVDTARDVLRSLKLCGASLLAAPRPTRINPEKSQELGGERYAALAAVPSKARVLVDASPVVSAMREQGLPLVEGLIAATLRPSARPGQFGQFFDSLKSEDSPHDHTYGVVQDGYLLVGDAGRPSTRPAYNGQRLPLQVASPTLSLVRLQLAASLRSGGEDAEGIRAADLAFWSTCLQDSVFVCRPALPDQPTFASPDFFNDF